MTAAIDRLRVLVVDDSDDDYHLVVRELRLTGLQVESARVDSAAGLRAALQEGAWQVAIVDHVIPGFGGPQALQIIREACPDLAAIVISGQVSEEVVAHDLQSGADDFLLKEDVRRRLGPALERALGVASARTEKRAAEEALLVSEHRYRELVETLQEGIWQIDADAVTTYANPRMAEMLGYTVQEMLGRPVFDFVADDDRQTMETQLERQRSGIQEQHEMRFQRKDGLPLWTSAAVTPLIDASGTYVGAIAGLQDVGDRRAAEQALLASQERLESIFHAAPDAIGLLHDRVMLEVNQRMCEMLGYSMEELVGNSARMLYPDEAEYARVGREKYAQIAATGCGSVETRWSRKDGSVIDILLSSAEIDPSDGTKGITFTGFDISDRVESQRRERQQTLRLRRTVEGAVRAMGTLVEMRDPYTAGHERRVTQLAAAIASRMGLDEECQQGLALASSVHDIGKIAVPAEILSKPGRLQEYEFSLVRQHPLVGAEVLAAIEFDRPVAQIVRQHHERIDGSGYPEGLRGDAILVEARILAVADVTEAMASHRPYRPALGIEAALDEISAGAGRLYDGEVVEACRALFSEGFVLDA